MVRTTDVLIGSQLGTGVSRGLGAVTALVLLAASATAQVPVRPAPPVAPLNGFVENRGQWPDEVLFFAQDRGIDLTLLPDALVFRPEPDRQTGAAPQPLVLRLPRGVAAQGEGVLPTQHNFLHGSIRVSHARGFERVVYHDLQPGLDLSVRVGAQGFEYDLQAAPGADIAGLALDVEGADNLSVDSGVLVMQTPAGRVEQRLGAAWQVDAGGAQVPVASAFRVLAPDGGALRFGFAAPGRDPLRAFVLDPSLVYATYVGGASQEEIAGMAVDAAGGVYLACRSTLLTPTTHGGFQPIELGPADAWVGKLSANGATLEWGTYLGGSDVDVPLGIAVDHDGTVVVLGNSWSSDFPTTLGSLQPTFAGFVNNNDDLFVTRLTPDGSSLVWSTYYGGPDFELATTVALFPGGDVLLAAEPNSADPPATPGAFDTVFVPNDQLIARISADGSRLVFQTYFKAPGLARLVVDSADNIYFCGHTGSQVGPTPTTPGAFKQVQATNSEDGYVVKMDPLGSKLIWSTLLGGDKAFQVTSPIGLAVDAASAVYVAGLTDSADFPVTAGAFATSPPASSTGFATKLLPNGSGLVWSTFIGAGPGGTSFLDNLAVDTAGNAVATGSSSSPGFPVTPDAFQTFLKGPSGDCHLTKFDAFGETLVYSTWFGGTSTDYITHVGLDAAQQPVMAFESYSHDLPTTAGAYDKTYNGDADLAVAKFGLPLAPWTVLGGGLKGSADVANLAGGGPLTPGSTARLSLRGGKPSAIARLIVGLHSIDLPLKGGTLVPAPDLLVLLATDAQGAFDLSVAWPALPAGTALTSQVWIKDPGAVHGWSASNALVMVSP